MKDNRLLKISIIVLTSLVLFISIFYIENALLWLFVTWLTMIGMLVGGYSLLIIVFEKPLDKLINTVEDKDKDNERHI